MKAIFIMNFTKLVEWPQAYREGNFVVGVVGESPMFQELSKMAKTKKVANQTLEIKKFDSSVDISKCHILYVSQNSKDDISDIFSQETRVACLKKATSTSQIIEAARDIGAKRYDTYTTNLLINSIMINGSNLFLSFVVPQESIVVPENIDAIIAQAGIMNKKDSIATTDKILGIDKIKQDMERLL